jgi:dipeptidyl aminopeptidase/acylaminoacyl peptidase
MAQSIEWCHALETMRVPTQMVVYPNEGHVFHKPDDAKDYTLRMLQWFDQWFAKGTD